jgi:hypothetical protein
MATKSVRAPNNYVLIAAGIALLVLAAFGVWTALASNAYPIPVLGRVVIGGSWDAILGAALLFVALRRSQFAGATAVIVATLLMFAVAFHLVMNVVIGSLHVGWRSGINLVMQRPSFGPCCFRGIGGLTSRRFRPVAIFVKWVIVLLQISNQGQKKYSELMLSHRLRKMDTCLTGQVR